MKDKKTKLILDNYELKILIYVLNEFRNKLITQAKYTDAVDDLLIKICK